MIPELILATFGTLELLPDTDSVLITVVSLFQNVLIREVVPRTIIHYSILSLIHYSILRLFSLFSLFHYFIPNASIPANDTVFLNILPIILTIPKFIKHQL